MKKTLLFIGAVALMLSACKKDKDGGAVGVLDPVQVQRALVTDLTGAWCGWCPNGSEKLIQLEHNYSYVLPVGIHTGDVLETPTATGWKQNFPSSGVPNFYVGNQNASQSPEGYVMTIASQTPTAGVGHEYTDAGTKLSIKSRVKFYNNDNGQYFMNVYFINGDEPASGSLLQSDFTGRLENKPNSQNVNTTYWKVDAAPVASGNLIKANSVFQHAHTILAHGDGLGTWGEQLPVSSVSAGDVYTLNYTLTKPFNVRPGYKVLTVIWKMEGTKAMFINGYMK